MSPKLAFVGEASIAETATSAAYRNQFYLLGSWVMTPLAQKTYTLLKQVPPGKVTTYKYLAQAAGTNAYRAIGQFMRANPFAPEVPCHRVVASDGSLGGFQGKQQGKAIERKIALLQAEGVGVQQEKIVDFQEHLFTFQS